MSISAPSPRRRCQRAQRRCFAFVHAATAMGGPEASDSSWAQLQATVDDRGSSGAAWQCDCCRRAPVNVLRARAPRYLNLVLKYYLCRRSRYPYALSLNLVFRNRRPAGGPCQIFF
eukprot:SAG31_NODE_3782_length_3884_cov_1.601057_6_plen_116_part_00